MSPRPAAGIVRELFLDAEGRRQPYPLYHELREAAPVHRNEFGSWMLSRFDDCRAALRDPRFGKDYVRQTEARFGPDWRRHPSLARGERSMLKVDGPDHTRLRKQVVKGFTCRRVDALRATMESTVSALLDDYEEQGGGDLMEDVAFPLPVTVIGEMIGIPAADRPPFCALVRDLVGTLEQRPTAEMVAAADAAQLVIRSYFLDLIGQKRRCPDDGLLSLLVHSDASERLGDDELVTMATLLFAAGFETTTNLIGNGVLALLRHPDELAALRADPALFANLPEELLRYDGTVQMAARVNTAPVVAGGIEIPAGEPVLVMLAAGNRDPARHPDPDRFDLRRADVDPLSFDPGDALCVEGAASNEVYAIAEGEALVTIGGKGAGRVREGDVVGERGPLEDRTRTATVTAATHMLTWAISRERFLGVVGRNSALATRMREAIAARYPQ